MTPENLENKAEAAVVFEQAAHKQAHEHTQPPVPPQPREAARKEAEALFAEIEAAAPEEPIAFDYKEDAYSELDCVPVTLSFELGKVCLPLSEVRTLGPGAIAQFSGGSPASIAIVSAGQTLGRGEIVDVEGRLGIRITQWGTPC